MSIHFHPVIVKEVLRETSDSVSILLDVPKSFATQFPFQQGQSLTIKCNIDGHEVRRSYSLCSSPLENEWKIAVKKVDAGIFSTFANQHLKKGDVLEIMPPNGKFNSPLNAKQQKKYLAFAAGSGITPILSIIKTTLATEPQSSFTLVYGNKSRSSVIFFEELEKLKNKYIHRFQLLHILSRERMDTEINFGRIDHQKLLHLGMLINYANIDEFFICGPSELIFSIKDYLERNGIEKQKIHFELFGSPNQSKSTTVISETENADNKICKLTIQTDGRSFDISLPLSSQTNILDAALGSGAELPYACKAGVCCTCKARLVLGQVSMDVHWGLDEQEINQGYILTCQAHPTSPEVIVDFDIK